MRGSIMIASALLAAALAPAAASEEPAPAAPSPAAASWRAFLESLRTLPDAMLAKLPPEWRRDDQVQAEVQRLILEALAARTLEAISGDGDRPVFLPYLNATLNVEQPNADTVYRAATIAPGGSYRLRGHRGSLRIAKIGQLEQSVMVTGFDKPVRAFAYHDLNSLKTDAAGRFDVILSPKRPPGHKGDWWELNPKTGHLFLRLMSSDWTKERDPTLSIERIDKPPYRPRPNHADLNTRLREVGTTTRTTALSFVDHVAKLRRDGFVNKLKIFDVSGMVSLEKQFYYEGSYDLRPDEALIVETKVPRGCRYFSLILTNHLYETTDWYNNHSSLNDSQLRIDRDGSLRVVVSAKDPGVVNWLDTAGYPIGVVQGRWNECDSDPVPAMRKVRLAEVRSALPPDSAATTPAGRERITRERRVLLQQRPLW